MTTHLADRILAVAYSLAAALLADPPAALALAVVVVATAILMALVWHPLKALLRGARRLMAHTERWIAVHVATHNLDREIEDLCDADTEPDPQHLPGVTRPGHATPPPPGHRRRMPRIPGRPRGRRRTTTSSSSDRRTR